MQEKSEFVKHIIGMIEPMGGVQSRAMFGGYGLYREGLMFALISDDTLFLKGDDLIRDQFEDMDLPPFRYERKGRQVSLSYYQAPEEALEDGSLLCQWAERAYQAAIRTNKGKSSIPRAIP